MVTFVLIVALVIAVAVLIGFVLGYNKLRAADVQVDEALGGIDVQLTRRAALIPSLVSTVGSFAAHEKAVLGHIADAQTALTAATSGKSVTQRSCAERQFETAVGQVLALGQTYPQLNSSTNFLNLQNNLADTEDKLAFARQYYNDSAATVNRLRTTIPWMFVAPMAGVPEREFYQVPKV
jgi:LemA protein